MSPHILTLLLVLVIAPLIAFVGGGMEIFLFIPSVIFFAGILAHGLFGASNQNKNTFLFVILTLLSFRVLIPTVPFDDHPELWIVNVVSTLSHLTGLNLSLCYGSTYYCAHYAQLPLYSIFSITGILLLIAFIIFVAVRGSKKEQDGKTKIIFQYIKPANYVLGLFLFVYLVVTLSTLLPYAHQRSIRDGGRQCAIDRGLREYFKSHPHSGVATGSDANGNPTVGDKRVYCF